MRTYEFTVEGVRHTIQASNLRAALAELRLRVNE